MTYDQAMRKAREGHCVARRSWRGAFKIAIDERGQPREIVNGRVSVRYYPGSFDAYATDWQTVTPWRLVLFIVNGICWVAALAALMWFN